MKPKPFESLNHFTVPVDILVPILDFSARRVRASRPGMMIKEGNGTADSLLEILRKPL
jgi:hypothetical protein